MNGERADWSEVDHIIVLFLDSEQYHTVILETPPTPEPHPELHNPQSTKPHHCIPRPGVSETHSARLQALNILKQKTPSHSNTTFPLHVFTPSFSMYKRLFQSRGIDILFGRAEGGLCVESSSQCRLTEFGDPAGTEDDLYCH